MKPWPHAAVFAAHESTLMTAINDIERFNADLQECGRGLLRFFQGDNCVRRVITSIW